MILHDSFVAASAYIQCVDSQLLQQGEVPCADEITPPPESRRRAFLALVVVAILCLSPAPHAEPALSLDSFAESFGAAGIAL